jgi:hypothetical protein
MTTKYSLGEGTSCLGAIRAAGLTTGIPEGLESDVASLIHASLSKTTWKKYGSGRNVLAAYQKYADSEFSWPLQPERCGLHI